MSASADLKADAHLIIHPEIRSDWSISLNARGRAILTDADIKWVSVRSLLQPKLDEAFAKAISDLNNMFSDAEYLKSQVSGFWKQICATKTSDGLLVVSPHTIAVTQPQVSDSGLRMTIVISAQVSLAASNPPECPPLPEKLILLDQN